MHLGDTLTKRLFSLSLLASLLLAGSLATAQDEPRLIKITFLRDGLTITKTDIGTVTLQLRFNKRMNPSITPTIVYGLSEDEFQTFPVTFNQWTENNTVWRGDMQVSEDVPANDGEYIFRISGAQDTSGVEMLATDSQDVNNTTLLVCRTGNAVLSADSLKFGTLVPGRSRDLTFTITNTSCADLRLESITTRAPFNFVTQVLPGTVLGDQQQVRITVRFQPGQRGAFADSVRITTTGNNVQTLFVHLSGAARGPQIVVTPTRIDFGNLPVNSSDSAKVYIQNRAAGQPAYSDTLRISSITTNAPVYSVNKSSLTIPPGGRDSLVVRFRPTQNATYNGRLLTITSNDSNQVTTNVTLNGQSFSLPNLTANWSGNYGGYARGNTLRICWDNSAVGSTIARVYYKFTRLRQPPTGPEDVDLGGFVQVGSIACVDLSLTRLTGGGRWYCYVWPVDGNGVSGWASAVEQVFVYDNNPPAKPSVASTSQHPKGWFSAGTPFNLTINIPVDQAPRNWPDAAEVRYKYKRAPLSNDDFHGRIILPNRSNKSQALVTIPFSADSLCGEGSVHFWLADSAGNTDFRNAESVPYNFDICRPTIRRAKSSEPVAIFRQAFADTLVVRDFESGLHPDSIWVSYRFGGAQRPVPPGRVRAQRLNDSTYAVNIPEGAVSRRGIEYRIEAEDRAGNRRTGFSSQNTCAADGWFPVATRVEGQGDFRIDADGKPVPLPHGSSQTFYSLFSIPYQLDSSDVLTVLEDNLGPYDDTVWRLYDYNPALEGNNRWLEGSDARDFMPGRAYFIITNREGIVIDSGPGKTVKTVCRDTIRVYPGWNLIATPFNFPIGKESVSLSSNARVVSGVYSYERGWNEVEVVEPWRGYAIFVDRIGSGTAPMYLYVEPRAIAGAPLVKAAEPAVELAGGEWMLRLRAQAGDAHDNLNWLGVRHGATEGYDELERPEPLIFGDYVSLQFRREAWQAPTSLFSTDFRPASADAGEQVWEFDVVTNLATTTVQVQFDFEGDIPAGADIYLIDEALGIARDLRQNPAYSFRSGSKGADKRLKVVVGSTAFVQQATGEIALVPAEFDVLQNYPNPFNPETSIRYNLAQSAPVSVVIYDQLGRKVRTLLDQAQQPAGYHTLIWDARDDAGQQVASGLYLYTVKAGALTQTRKMVLLR